MQIKTIVLHHTATQGIGDGSVEWEAIKKACRIKRGGNYICDYHYGIGPTGEIFLGQQTDQPAWHSGRDEVNYASLAVACIGNFEINQMGDSQFQTLEGYVRYLKNKYQTAKILLHSDIVATLCPGKLFPYSRLMDALYKKVMFRDVTVECLFYKAINEVARRGIINGDTTAEGTFRPNDKVTRGELAQIICNMLNINP